MKTLFLLFLAVITGLPLFSQEDTLKNTPGETKVINENTSLSVNDEEIISVKEGKDTTKIKIGNKGIIIVETDDGTNIHVKDIDKTEKNNKEENDTKSISKSSKGFDGHWSGIQVGLNNYVNSDFSMSLNNSMNYMDLNTSRSWTYSLNFLKYDFGFGTHRSGLVTGLGIEWSNYNFDNDFNIRTSSNGIIEPYDLSGLEDIQKNKLQTTYLNLPLLLECQIPSGKKSAYISGGLIGSLKIGSHTKIVYKDNGDKRKIKDKDDYNLSALRYGFTFRAGYRGLNLFASYYLTPLFEANKGPELYPFSIGLVLIDF